MSTETFNNIIDMCVAQSEIIQRKMIITITKLFFAKNINNKEECLKVINNTLKELKEAERIFKEQKKILKELIKEVE